MTPATCKGSDGLFRGSSGGGEIHICVGDDTPELRIRKTVLHEVAHAWTLRRLSADDIVGFLALRRLEHWSEPATWHRRGMEHAAEIMAWGLIEREVRLPLMQPNDRASLDSAFEFLTGREPIVGPPVWKVDAGTRPDGMDAPPAQMPADCCPRRVIEASLPPSGGNSEAALSGSSSP